LADAVEVADGICFVRQHEEAIISHLDGVEVLFKENFKFKIEKTVISKRIQKMLPTTSA
jgi:hypothetical protein